MGRAKWLAIAVVVLIAAGATWYFASPAYTLSQMKAAAEENDSDAFASYIDFPALREDMKAELMAQIMIQAQKDTSGFGGLGMALGSAMVGPMIDGMISPAGVRAMFISKRNQSNPPNKAMGALQVEESPIIERRGFSEFLVTSKGKPGSGMVFKRHGLGWKLSGVDLPAPNAN